MGVLAHPHYQASDKKMILEEETYSMFGYCASDLALKSHKRILAGCDKCGKIRETSKNNYSALCRSCSMKEKYPSEEARKRMSDTHKGKKHPMFGKHYSEKIRKNMSEAQKGKHHSEETRERLSIVNRGKHLSEATRRKISDATKGKNNPSWKGGISFEPYCIKFDKKFKQYIRDKFDNICFLCGKTEEKNGEKLSVHHVNYSKLCGCAETEEDKKTDDNECQFVPLCRSCHSKVHSDRDYWEIYFKKKLRNTLNGWYI
jgi:hypothetical protein